METAHDGADRYLQKLSELRVGQTVQMPQGQNLSIGGRKGGQGALDGQTFVGGQVARCNDVRRVGVDGFARRLLASLVQQCRRTV